MNIRYPSREKFFDENIKAVIVLPHSYNFDSGSGIPCMITNPEKRITASLVNLQKTFKISSCDFSDIWNKGVLLYNVALTTEEDSEIKIPHEIFWSRLFEKFVEYVCSNSSGVTFCLTGATCGEYKGLIDLSRGHTVTVVPTITSPDFSSVVRTHLGELDSL